jgi:hypothetical protein
MEANSWTAVINMHKFYSSQRVGAWRPVNTNTPSATQRRYDKTVWKFAQVPVIVFKNGKYTLEGAGVVECPNPFPSTLSADIEVNCSPAILGIWTVPKDYMEIGRASHKEDSLNVLAFLQAVPHSAIDLQKWKSPNKTC